MCPLVYSADMEFRLPVPGVMVHLSPPINPPVLKGIKVHPDNPFRFDFILDKGDSESNSDQLKDESTRLIKYFLASLTIPEKDLWVNLSPYEKDRIIPQSFGLTEMGRDLLAEDYMLKQITASLIYPEDQVGKRFWKRIYEEATKKFGTTNVPVNTFNKVWIVPEKAVVYENDKTVTAYVMESKLKVMLEQDYLSLTKHEGIRSLATVITAKGRNKNSINALGSQIVREVVIPELTKEVNEGNNFAQLRQVYNSLILAAWYKKKIKDSLLSQVYADKNKVAGVEYTSTITPAKAGVHFKNDVEGLYQEYLRAFKKGVYNYIKEEVDPITQEAIPRKYFSGGLMMDGHALDAALITTNQVASNNLTEDGLERISLVFNPYRNQRNGSQDLAMNNTNPSMYGDDFAWYWRVMHINEFHPEIQRLADSNEPDMFDKFEVYLNKIKGSNASLLDINDARMMIEILSHRKDNSRFIRTFESGVRSESRFIRLASVEACERVNDTRVNRALIRAVRDDDTRISLKALDILEKLGMEENIPELLQIAHDLPEEEVFYIYDDHGSRVAYAQPAVEHNYSTRNFKLRESMNEDNFVKKKIIEVVESIKKRWIEKRKAAKIDLSDVEDPVFREFMQFLKDNDLGDILVFGGGVWNAITGRRMSDFDITVAVPLDDEEYYQSLSTLSQANERVIVYVRQRLIVLAKKLGIPFGDFFDSTKKIIWHGKEGSREIQYSGPFTKETKKTNGETKDISGVYIKRALVDSNSLGLFSSSAGASILQMAVDANGQLYGHVESLDDLASNNLRITGKVEDVDISMVLRIVKLQCELGLKVHADDEEVLRGVVRRYIDNGLYKKDLPLKNIIIEKKLESIAGIVRDGRSKINPMERFQELGLTELIQDKFQINLGHYFNSAMVTSKLADQAMQTTPDIESALLSLRIPDGTIPKDYILMAGILGKHANEILSGLIEHGVVQEIPGSDDLLISPNLLQKGPIVRQIIDAVSEQPQADYMHVWGQALLGNYTGNNDKIQVLHKIINVIESDDLNPIHNLNEIFITWFGLAPFYDNENGVEINGTKYSWHTLKDKIDLEVKLNEQQYPQNKIEWREVVEDLTPFIKDFFRFMASRVKERFSADSNRQADSAVTSTAEKRGGIDLTLDNLHLQIKNSNGEIKLHIDPAMLRQLQNALGFIPVIISIQPMTNLKQFLGVPNSPTTPAPA